MEERYEALFAAIERNDSKGVESALGAGADPNARQGHAHTALSRAVCHDSERIVAMLLKAGADPDSRSQSGETPLHNARLASREVFDRLIRAGADPNARDGIGETPLHPSAARSGFDTSVQRLLESGADPNAETHRGVTPLHLAESVRVIDRLVRWGADPNAADKLGQTALHHAVSDPDADSLARYDRVVRLLNAGADPNARARWQETPLHRATSLLRDSTPTVRQLLDAGADARAVDEFGNTPLHYAAGRSSIDRAGAIDHLVRAGARLDARNRAGDTPLHCAAANGSAGQARAITRLLSAGADTTIRNHEGRTSLDVAASTTAKEIITRRWPATARHPQETRVMEKQPEKDNNTPTVKDTPKKPDPTEEFHKRFAEAIIKQIEQGTAPWQKPWKPGERVLPMNVNTGRAYSGGNSLHLAVVAAERGYSDVRWGTYRQIRAMGGHVRKGERGTRILSVQDRKLVGVTDDKGQPARDADGHRMYRHERLSSPMVRQYTVFNAEQAEGLPPKPEPAKQPLWEAHQKADQILEANKVPIRHVAGDRAYYNMKRDEIVLPEREQFASANNYYQTALHEVGHSTGHPDRMNRATLTEGVKAGFGSEAYAKEELRAEISAMMTGERVGVGHDPSRGAAYVESWVKALKEDPREIRRAAADAQKISDYVLARGRERDPEREPEKAPPPPAAERPAAVAATAPMEQERTVPVPDRSFGPSR